MHPRSFLQSFLFVWSIAPKPENILFYPLEMLWRLGECAVRNNAADDREPYGKKAAELKEMCKRDLVVSRAKGKPDAGENVVIRWEKGRKRKTRKMKRMRRNRKTRKGMVTMHKFILVQFLCSL